MQTEQSLSVRGEFLRIENNTVFYLGYVLPLSDAERDILLRIMKAYPNYICAKDLDSEAFLLSGDPVGLLRKHVSHINAKSLVMGKRKIIESRKNLGYKIAFSL